MSTICEASEQMMQHVHVKLNPGLPWQKQHSTGRVFHLRTEEQTSEVLHLEHNIIWC